MKLPKIRLNYYERNYIAGFTNASDGAGASKIKSSSVTIIEAPEAELGMTWIFDGNLTLPNCRYSPTIDVIFSLVRGSVVSVLKSRPSVTSTA